MSQILQRYYRGYILKTEESGNVSIYAMGSFMDKVANMSEAQALIDNLITKAERN